MNRLHLFANSIVYSFPLHVCSNHKKTFLVLPRWSCAALMELDSHIIA